MNAEIEKPGARAMTPTLADIVDAADHAAALANRLNRTQDRLTAQALAQQAAALARAATAVAETLEH